MDKVISSHFEDFDNFQIFKSLLSSLNIEPDEFLKSHKTLSLFKTVYYFEDGWNFLIKKNNELFKITIFEVLRTFFYTHQSPVIDFVFDKNSQRILLSKHKCEPSDLFSSFFAYFDSSEELTSISVYQNRNFENLKLKFLDGKLFEIERL